MDMKCKKDAVILATFKFCNRLGNYDIIDQKEWPEITRSTPLAIYDSHEKNNSIERPDFYEKWLDRCQDGYIAALNSKLFDDNSRDYLDPLFVEPEPNLFIAKAANQHIKVGDTIKRKVFPENVAEVFNEHREQILLDSYLWRSNVRGQVLIRKEFFD